nr:MAG TPA: hypothetical protein [Caudoviricetes sp.]
MIVPSTYSHWQRFIYQISPMLLLWRFLLI